MYVMDRFQIALICSLSVALILWYTIMCIIRALILQIPTSSLSAPPKWQGPNVLFICVDDLSKDISPYNKLRDRNDPFYQMVYTPNLERLASDSLLLTQAYNQFIQAGHLCSQVDVPIQHASTTSRRCSEKPVEILLRFHSILRIAGIIHSALGKCFISGGLTLILCLGLSILLSRESIIIVPYSEVGGSLSRDRKDVGIHYRTTSQLKEL